jgi:DNA-binding IclR family transcriptional regulator
MSANSNYIVKPVDKALQVLTLLAEANGDLPLKEICARTGLPKTTAFRYLYTLNVHGYVVHNGETDLYRLGPRSWQLGQAADQYSRLLEVALAPMQALRDRFDETVNLGVLNHTEVVYLGMVESRRTLRMQARLGSQDPTYSTSLGKAILAFLPEANWNNHLPARLAPRTPHTITSRAALQQELLLTRQRGYALDQSENEEGAYCIGAPILHPQQGRVIAALSVAAPASRLSVEQTHEVAQAIIATAELIARRLATSPSTELTGAEASAP